MMEGGPLYFDPKIHRNVCKRLRRMRLSEKYWINCESEIEQMKSDLCVVIGPLPKCKN